MLRNSRLVALTLVAALAPLASAAAQKTVISISGSVMRYHGDTIWMERDSTTRESITRGDTVEMISTMNGAIRAHTLYLVQGDSAWFIHDGARAARAIPSNVATSLNTMLELELRNEKTFSTLDALPSRSRTAPPVSPETTVTYKVSPVVRIAQRHDTLTYIRGCEGAHNDTTLFLLFGRDSVKRISAPERMFGQAMATGLYSQMRMSLIRDFTKAFQAPLPSDMPKVPGGCPH